jgi:hypothetical protein
MGPLLFLLYINDIGDIINKNVSHLLYADDVKLYTTVETTLDYEQLQTALNRIHQWSITWQLKISVSKCLYMEINGKPTRKIPNNYKINDLILPKCQFVKDLGVTVDPTLKFDKHISEIVGKAKKTSGLIFKCFTSKDTGTLLRHIQRRYGTLQAFNIWTW